MRWRGGRQSGNVIDARSRGSSGRGVSGARIGGVGGLGLLAIVVIGLFFGIDLTPLLGMGSGSPAGYSSGPVTQADEERGQFASTVLAFTEDVWNEKMPAQMGEDYTEPQLVLFKGAVQSGCGGASAATGPFYCPLDNRIYLDTDFFVEMKERFGAPGDFAAAYVIAHEVGHHIQDQLGILDQARNAQGGRAQAEANAIQVRVELMADCLAGVWAKEADNQFGVLEPGDFDEALNAARAIGDDELQRQAGRAVQPHTFTHGSSAQRQRWFAAGYESGDMNSCDTFGASTL